MKKENNAFNLGAFVPGLSGVILLALILTLRRDGTFPLSENSSVWAQIGATLFLLALIGWAIKLIFHNNLPRIWQIITGLLKPRLFSFGIFLANFLIVISFGLIWYSARPYAAIYQIDQGVLLFVLLSVLLGLNALYLTKKPVLMVAGIFLSAITLFSYAAAVTPVSAKLADLLPIIQRQGEALLSGQNIYQYYLLDNGIWTQAVRQPGVVLAYLPAVFAGFDLRVMSILYQIAGGLILLDLAYPGYKKIVFNHKFLLVIVLLVLYLFLPYRILRTDLYDPPYWFLLIGSLWALIRKKHLTWAILNGIAIATQIWAWVTLPFFCLFILRTKGKLFNKVLTITVSIVIGALLLAVFIIPSPSAYFEHVFGFFNQMVTVNGYPMVTLFLTPLVFELGLGGALRWLQFAFCAIAGFAALFRLKSMKALFGFVILAVFIFIQFNIVSWMYMYLIIYYLVITYLLYTIGGPAANAAQNQ